MLRSLLLFTLLCTCGPAYSQNDKPPKGLFGGSAFNLGAVQLNIDMGYSLGHFNQQPELINFTSSPDQRDILRTINSGTIGFAADYAPANTKFSCGLKFKLLQKRLRTPH